MSECVDTVGTVGTVCECEGVVGVVCGCVFDVCIRI